MGTLAIGDIDRQGHPAHVRHLPQEHGAVVNDLRALQYYGGKARKAQWIAELLPWEQRTCYMEPFSGMASVLLARAPVNLEILNDLNGRVINWWRAIRDESAEFARLLQYTPHSRNEYIEACKQLDDATLAPIRRALAFHIVVQQGVMHADNVDKVKGSFGRSFHANSARQYAWRPERVEALARRLRHVTLEEQDAMKLLARTAPDEGMVIYADPPYHSTDNTGYDKGVVNVDGLAEAFQAQKGRVAISGYRDEWDRLGWVKYQRTTRRQNIGRADRLAMPKNEERPEALWMNYQPPMMLL